MANFALTLVHGPGWDHTLGIREQRGWTEHAAFMDGLVTDGFFWLAVQSAMGSRRCTWLRHATRRRSVDAWPRIPGPPSDSSRSARSNPGRSGSTSARP